jgi:flagellar P-ring protein FlgI
VKHLIASLSAALLGLVLLVPSVASAGRIKDVARWEGVEENVVVGWGVVIGLQGTGDQSSTVREFLRNSAGSLETDFDSRSLRPKNAALVMVTATLPPFARTGNTIDVTVASVGDAKSLSGGLLLPTMLKDAQGQETWAVADGPLTVGGFSASAGGSSATKNHTNTARIPGGAKVVREMDVNLLDRPLLRLSLHDADFRTAVGAARSINRELLGDFAYALDSGTVEVTVPPQFQGRVPELVARLEGLDVEVDRKAKVIVNERTGTVVMGADVRIATVAFTHGGLTIEIDTRTGVSQPGAFSAGETVAAAESEIQVKEEYAPLQVLDGVSIGEIVGSLNQLGVAPRDLVSILQAIEAAGALEAELEVI